MPKLYTKSFVIICIANLLLTIAFYALLPTIPFYLTDVLKGDNANIGMILSVYTLSALAIRPFVGYLLDSYGRKAIFIAAFLIFALLSGSYAWAGTILAIFILRFLHGGAWGTVSSAGQTIAVDLIPAQRRGEGIGIYGISSTISMALGPLLGITILKITTFGYLFLFSFLIVMLGFFLIWFINYPEYKPQKLELKLKNFIEKKAIPIGLIAMIFTLSYGGIVGFIALFIREIGNSLDSRIFFLLFAVGIALSRIFSGRIVDRSGPEKIVIIGFSTLIFSFIILGLVKIPLIFYINSSLIGIGCGILIPTFQTIVNNAVTKERRGVANTTFFTFFDLGIGIGSLITGIISKHLNSLGYTYLLYSLTNLSALLLFLLWAKRNN